LRNTQITTEARTIRPAAAVRPRWRPR
jgi:hypothetical protein